MCRSALSALMLLAASASFAQKVHVEFDKGVDFSKFKTYAWLESKHPAQGAWAQQVVADIDGRKGLKRVDTDAGLDPQVVYNTGVKERIIVEGYSYGYVPEVWLSIWSTRRPKTWSGVATHSATTQERTSTS
jgi:hypothetical protein